MIFKNWSFLLELSNSWAQRGSTDVIIETVKILATPADIDQEICLTLAFFFFQFKIHTFDYSPVTRVCDTLELSLLHASKGIQGQYTTGLEGVLPCQPQGLLCEAVHLIRWSLH